MPERGEKWSSGMERRQGSDGEAGCGASSGEDAEGPAEGGGKVHLLQRAPWPPLGGGSEAVVTLLGHQGPGQAEKD